MAVFTVCTSHSIQPQTGENYLSGWLAHELAFKCIQLRHVLHYSEARNASDAEAEGACVQQPSLTGI